ncbi:Pleiotropic drug resistance protein ABC Superfamily, partial [Phytophthora palmivora]
MGGNESNEVAKDDARLQHPMVIRSPAKQQDKKSKDKQAKDKEPKSKKPEVTTAKDGSTTVVSTAQDGNTTAVTTSADGCTVTTVVTRPDGSSETTTEIVTTTETEVDVTQQHQGVSPTAAAAARAVADFESVSEEKTDQSLAELAWHAWSASATAAAMGVKDATAETLRALSENSGVLFTSTVVTPPTDAGARGDMARLEAGEWKKEDFKKLLPAFLTYVTSHGRRFETVTAVELFIFARAFCRFRVLKHHVDQEKDKGRRSKERKVAWELTRAFTLYYPEFPIHRRGLRFSKTNAVLMDQAQVESESSFELISVYRRLSKWLNKIIVISLLRDSSEDCTRAKNVIVLHDGEAVRSGSWDEIIKYVQELGVQCPSRKDVTACLDTKNATAALYDQHDATINSTTIFRLADEVVLLAGSPIVEASDQSGSYLMNVSNFTNAQVTSSSKQAENSDKHAVGAFIYEFHLDKSSSDSDSNDDEDGFDAGDWLMSWFQPRTHSPPLTTNAAARKLLAHWTSQKHNEYNQPSQSVKTEVFCSEEADGSIVTKTVRTTTRTETSPAGELVTTIEVETTTETATKGGAKSTTVETETTTETATEVPASTSITASTEGMTAVSSTEEAGAVPGETVKTEVFRSEEADGSIVTKT